MKNPEKGKVVKANFPFKVECSFAGGVKVSFSYPRWYDAKWSGKRWMRPLEGSTYDRVMWGESVVPAAWKDA